ncbi:leucine-rich repeat domain-containing protein [Allomuricauda taeanensis]|uniref:leucine-rich repeat domain-containing protein n=1 Tax=Flagellimonas taeanensis TaxID=1005926 RepID=UPI002E7C41B5|nr:leucine-rich repeat domain-containing protein [Allomuricauda taeanensis]MEE1964618.1 leucine-rich repeat domain-containing protein [Allomuricauda taeanensis]
MLSTSVDGIEIVTDSYIVEVNDSIQLKTVILPESAANKKVVWESDAPAVATIREGWVKGKASGKVNIKAISEENSQIIASATVDVIGVTNAITSFTINGAIGVIDNDSIRVTLPGDMEFNKLAPVISHNGNTISPESGVERDFTDPVEYIVTAENGETRTYTVTIEKELKSSNSITSFKVNGNAAMIEGDAISFTFPADSNVDLTKLKPEIVHTGEKITPDSGVEQDFTDPVEYMVTAENGETRTYTVTIDEVELTAAESDRAALMAIYDANPDSQTILTDWGWGSEKPLNEWSRVFINAEGRVTELGLTGLDLKVLPSKIGDLSALENLELGYNQLANIPLSIGNLTSLKFLYLSDNQLTEIPDAIGDLTGLKSLLLHNNPLTSIPSSVCELGSSMGSNFAIDDPSLCE